MRSGIAGPNRSVKPWAGREGEVRPATSVSSSTLSSRGGVRTCNKEAERWRGVVVSCDACFAGEPCVRPTVCSPLNERVSKGRREKVLSVQKDACGVQAMSVVGG